LGIVIAFAYFFGAIPFSLIVGKLFFRVDLRKEGSGNLGTTNTFRILGVKPAIAILILDMLKGVLPVMLARFLGGTPLSVLAAAQSSPTAQAWLMIAGALTAVIGHSASPYIKFRGGKGAATTAGVMLALMPKVFIIAAILFIGTVALTHYVSVGTLAVALTFPVLTALFYPQLPYILLSLIVAVILIYLHRANIKRLKEGTEPRFSWKNRGSAGEHREAEEDASGSSTKS